MASQKQQGKDFLEFLRRNLEEERAEAYSCGAEGPQEAYCFDKKELKDWYEKFRTERVSQGEGGYFPMNYFKAVHYWQHEGILLTDNMGDYVFMAHRV